MVGNRPAPGSMEQMEVRMPLRCACVCTHEPERRSDRVARVGLLIGLTVLVGSLTGFTVPYREEAVANGAALSGRVTMVGPTPAPLQYRVTMGANPEFCQRSADKTGRVSVPQAMVSANGELAGAIVFVQELDHGKPFSPEGPLVTVEDCRFDTHVLAAGYGRMLRVRMKDPIIHQIRGWEMMGTRRLPLFQLAQIDAGQVRAASLKTRRSSIVKLECDQHRFMQAWVLLVTNPYFAITDADGRFEIADLPAGTYAVGAWHPVLGYQESTVTVQSGARATVSFRLIAPAP